MKYTTATLLLAAHVAFLTPASALVDPDLSGTTEFEIWTGLTAANYPSYPDFSDTGDGGFADPWPAPIAPSGTGSAGNASLDKVSGGGYPATSSIYNHTVAGTYEIANGSPLANLGTVIVQIDLGDGSPGAFQSAPVLNYNGGSQSLTANFTNTGPGGFSGGFGGPPSPTTLHGFQWDLSSVRSAISSYAILWTSDTFSTTYEIRLDSSDTTSPNRLSAIPETSSTMGILTLIGWAFLRRRGRG